MDETRKVIRKILGEALRRSANWKDALQIDPDAYVASLAGMFQAGEIAGKLIELAGNLEKRANAVADAEETQRRATGAADAHSLMAGVRGSAGFIHSLALATKQAGLLDDVLSQEGTRESLVRAADAIREMSYSRRIVVFDHPVWQFLKRFENWPSIE